jgi:MFS family permease
MGVSKGVQITIVVYAAIFLNYLLVGSITPLLPRIGEAHGLSPEQRSYMLSAKSIFHMASSPVLAVMSSRFNSDVLFLFGVLAVAAAYVGIAVSSSLAGFIVARSCQGIGVACIIVAGMSLLIRAIPPDKRGKYVSLSYSALGRAYLIGPLVSGLMYDYLGQFWTFMIPGLITIACAFISAVFFLKSKHQTSPDPQSTGEEKLEFKLILSALKATLAQPVCIMALVGVFFTGITFGCIEIVVPKIIADWNGGGLSVIDSNLIWSVGPLAFTLMAPVAGPLIDKLGAVKMFVIGQFLMALFYPFFTLMEGSLVGVGSIVAIAFAIEAIMELSSYALVAHVNDATHLPKALPVGYSLNEMSMHAGFAVGDLIGSLLATWMGLLGVGVVTATGNGFLGLLSIFLVVWRLKGHDESPEHSNSRNSQMKSESYL